MIIKVWHKEGHDEYTTTEMEAPRGMTFTDYIRELHGTGGFRYGDQFVPWHNVNFIKKVSE